jgi:hypothetical protein
MTAKEQFLAFVCVGAVAQDVRYQTHSSRDIVSVASEIEEEALPPSVVNAALVFLAYLGGRTDRPHAWMFPDPPDMANLERLYCEDSRFAGDVEEQELAPTT